MIYMQWLQHGTEPLVVAASAIMLPLHGSNVRHNVCFSLHADAGNRSVCCTTQLMRKHLMISNVHPHCRQAARIAGSVAVLHSFPMLGMAALKALMNGRAEELLPNEPDPRAALQRVIEGCSLAPFMDVLCGPAVDACTGLMTDAMDVITSSQVRAQLPPCIRQGFCLGPHDHPMLDRPG